MFLNFFIFYFIFFNKNKYKRIIETFWRRWAHLWSSHIIQKTGISLNMWTMNQSTYVQSMLEYIQVLFSIVWNVRSKMLTGWRFSVSLRCFQQVYSKPFSSSFVIGFINIIVKSYSTLKVYFSNFTVYTILDNNSLLYLSSFFSGNG